MKMKVLNKYIKIIVNEFLIKHFRLFYGVVVIKIFLFIRKKKKNG